MILLMQSNYSDPVNLGNPDEYTILDFANNIIESIGQCVCVCVCVCV